MSEASEAQWREAVQATLATVGDAVRATDSAYPRTRYSRARRLWWRVFGVPADVRAARFQESALRANRFMAELHARARPS